MRTPSNRVGITLITVASLVTVIIVFSSISDKFSKEDTNSELKKQLSVELKTGKNSTDTDGDGLTDWEEVLWGTDPKNKDSDGDKTNDGEEVTNNRNPKVAGPNDIIYSQEEISEQYVPQETDDNSLTSSVARTLFTNFANLNSTGQVTPENSQKIAEEIINEASGEINLVNYYSPDNLITFKSSDKDALKQYGNKIIEITVTNMQTAVEKPESNNNLSVFSNAYFDLARKLALIPVPEELRNTHTNYINNFYKLARIIESFGESENDPFLSLILIPKYEEIAKDQALSTEQIANFLKDSGIIYSSTEYGSFLYTKGI